MLKLLRSVDRTRREGSEHISMDVLASSWSSWVSARSAGVASLMPERVITRDNNFEHSFHVTILRTRDYRFADTMRVAWRNINLILPQSVHVDRLAMGVVILKFGLSRPFTFTNHQLKEELNPISWLGCCKVAYYACCQRKHWALWLNVKLFLRTWK